MNYLAQLLKNKITPDMSVSTSSEFNDSEIPTSSVCRICFESDFDETNKLISPCFCRGSMSKVHKTCLEQWLLLANSSVCGICTFKYKTRRGPKYSFLGAIKAWFLSSETEDQVSELYFDGLVLLIMLPIRVISSYAVFCLAEHVCNADVQIEDDLTYCVLQFIDHWSINSANFNFYSWTIGRVEHHFINWYNFYISNQWIVLESEPENSM